MPKDQEHLEDPHAGPEDMQQIRELLSLSPHDRLLRHAQMAGLIRAVREAGNRYYGNRPPTAEDSR
jgi:hypothetical protein